MHISNARMAESRTPSSVRSDMRIETEPLKSLPRLMPLLVVLPKNVHQESKPSSGRGQKTDHRQAGVTKQQEPSLHAHQQRRADDQRRQDQPGRNPVGHLLGALDQKLGFARPYGHF